MICCCDDDDGGGGGGDGGGGGGFAFFPYFSLGISFPGLSPYLHTLLQAQWLETAQIILQVWGSEWISVA